VSLSFAQGDGGGKFQFDDTAIGGKRDRNYERLKRLRDD
jgi:hypothetical protein